jgi:uncharacterized protein (AIM24 family)
MIFGGDGTFLAALTGPGRVWLQSTPISKLAHALMEYLPSGRENNAPKPEWSGGLWGRSWVG